MAQIEVEPGLVYDDTKAWFEQEPSLVQLGEDVLKNPQPYHGSVFDEFTDQGKTVNRPKKLIFIYTNSSNQQFRFQVDFFYVHNPNDANWEKTKKAWNARSKQSTVTLTQI